MQQGARAALFAASLVVAACGTEAPEPSCGDLPDLQERRACRAATPDEEPVVGERCGDGVVSEYLPQDVRFEFEDGEYPELFSGDWVVQRRDDDTSFVMTNPRLLDDESARVEWTTDVLVVSEISFDVRVSSESCCDELRFFIDDIEQEEWAGDVPWRLATFDVAQGRHTFAWEYAKDFSLSIGLDAAFVDNVALIAAEAVIETCDDGNTEGGDGCSATCAVE